ncbi:hypothetical protein C7293_23010 [filamentous cyanobacterium CCT1]|nr:hypothetical protein C7293_23010 [filamentous cyanobacterium CCT1]PSN78157.1 hypothetical protein C8B47_18295 [filamentous cyanobacterium CCP4]
MSHDKTYTILELTPAPQPCAPAAPRPSLWRRLGAALLRWLTTAHEPTIRSTTLASGEKQWRVFNPVTDTTLVFDSEEAVCAWLETGWLHKPAQPDCAQPDLIGQMRYRLR